MAAELHLCDLLLLKVDRGSGCSVTTLASRQQAVLTDLTRLLPRLATLQFGELDARVVPDAQGYRMRLLLRPRQRSLLLDPKNGRPTLEGEIAMLRDDIEKVGLRVMRAAREVKGSKATGPGASTDPMHELLVRRARQQWRFMVEHRQLELPFPDWPRVCEDEVAHRIEGVVHAIGEHWIVMHGVEVWTLGENARVIARMGALCIETSASSLAGPTDTVFKALQCGRRWSRLARLKRCTTTCAVVGATEVAAGASCCEAA